MNDHTHGLVAGPLAGRTLVNADLVGKPGLSSSLRRQIAVRDVNIVSVLDRSEG
ncbi:MAG TPA: hypothetical protein VNS88_03190 [Nitrospiraceae bacterium]|nr:hypothetical protein [Nitrospiraceae bacterium]